MYFKYLQLLLIFVIVSCADNDTNQYPPNTLEAYIVSNQFLEKSSLIACAASEENKLLDNSIVDTSIFFYPEEGATNFQYFEADNIADSLDFSKYVLKELPVDFVFNGYLRKFNRGLFEGEKMGIVTYKTKGSIHISDPIRLKTNIKPTEKNNELVTINTNRINPIFIWKDGKIDENIIYFQVVSDIEGNLISGTYTFEKTFKFYDTSNVVLNITDESNLPVLQPKSNYMFTLMAVSEDNWVNLFIEKKFLTD